MLILRIDTIANVKIDLDDIPSYEHHHKRAFTVNLGKPLGDEGRATFQIDNSDGLLGLALRDIFVEMDELPDKKFFLKCSYLEIYNDLVFDLLKSQSCLGETLSIHEDQNVRSILSSENRSKFIPIEIIERILY